MTMLSDTFSVAVLIVVVVPFTVKSPPIVIAPDTARDVSVPTEVRLDDTTLDASVVPVMPLAAALLATACPLVQTNLLSMALIAALSTVPQPVSPFSGIGVTPSISSVTVGFSVSNVH